MVFPTDNQEIVFALIVQTLVHALEPDVVIRILCVPIKGLGNRPSRHFRPNHIGHIRGLFGLQDDEVVDWRIGGNYDRIGSYDKATSLDPGGRTSDLGFRLARTPL